MRTCEYCGTELQEDQKICPCCGEEVPQEDYWAQRLSGPQPDPEDGDRRPAGTQRQSKPRGEDAREIPGEYLDILEPDGRRAPRWVWILLGILLAAGLVLAGLLIWRPWETGETYYGRVCTLGDQEYSAEEDWVTLKPRGRAEVCLLDRRRRGSWEIRDNRLLLTCGEDRYTGRCRDGILTLEQEDRQFILTREGVAWEKAEEKAPSQADPAAWAGDYYGWWQVTEAWGGWEAYAGQRYSACGRIAMTGGNTGTLELWDELCGPGQLTAAADLAFGPGLTEKGCLQSGAGQFLDLPLAPGAWYFDPGQPLYGQTRDLLILSGTQQDGEDGYRYLLVLRPWGTDWEDMAGMRCSLLPVSDRLPGNYKTWYLPLLSRGEAMPETMADGAAAK